MPSLLSKREPVCISITEAKAGRSRNTVACRLIGLLKLATTEGGKPEYLEVYQHPGGMLFAIDQRMRSDDAPEIPDFIAQTGNTTLNLADEPVASLLKLGTCRFMRRAD